MRCGSIERGDLTPAQMVGGLHGEIGQTQFLPSSYVAFAVDFDGNGRADLIRSTADVLASTANYLQGQGLEEGRRLDAGIGEFRRHQGVEQVGRLFAHRGGVRATAEGRLSRERRACIVLGRAKRKPRIQHAHLWGIGPRYARPQDDTRRVSALRSL